MNDKINIGQWLAFVGPQIVLIFQIWREGRFDRQSNAQCWQETQKEIANINKELLKISQRVERLEMKQSS